MQGLHDIVLTEPITYLPQTTAWYVLLAVLLIMLVTGAIAWGRHARRNRYRKLALRRLSEIAERRTYEELPVLVKQTALCAYARDEVASLSGEAWLRFLDESYGGREFSKGAGRILPTLAYGQSADVRADDIVALIRNWIRNHHVRV